MAWLRAVPEDPPGAKRLSDKPAQAERKSRLQVMKEKKEEPDFPEVELGGYLVEYLMEVGPVASNGMGTDRISFLELESWQEQMGIALAPWEIRMLRMLSGEYAGESHRATAHDCPPPWLAVPDEMDREAISKGLESSFAALIQSRANR